ncbi:pulmonary surfactant-associated protein B [Platysternon megacephalum]|uniref:Pulmonary surfactant-associated protein B n=1 Tax=Platysternon megacephalum TaxID=55544 RepID=A0A4D9DUB0_9SAUR|nr:pulmonary surfactant-associated protein B [Platysternon megacephalum]
MRTRTIKFSRDLGLPLLAGKLCGEVSRELSPEVSRDLFRSAPVWFFPNSQPTAPREVA